ncbi:microtubule cross-linking factor 1-like [Lemur catta]|uniref:microtubule cross-linking factor 1-like n=1 Tax=Lemur catta TaxID=9447 RepID=UPI001E267E97|nr:microtubule cross-linking factor 1-like [Lemur catta]
MGVEGKQRRHRDVFKSTREEHSDSFAKLVACFPARHPGCGRASLPPRGRACGPGPGLRQDGTTPAPSAPRAALLAGRAGAGKGEHGANSRGPPGAVLLFPFALLLPRPGPGVTGKPPERPGGGLFIERAARASRSPARLTGPLTRLAEGPGPWGCAPGAGDNGLLCVQLPPPPPPGAGGGQRAAAPRLPYLSAATPRKVTGLFCPPARTRASRAFFFFFPYCSSKFPLPQAPLLLPPFPPNPNMTREGDLSGRRGRPLCAPRGAGPTPGAPSRGCGDRGAGSAGQLPGAGKACSGASRTWQAGRELAVSSRKLQAICNALSLIGSSKLNFNKAFVSSRLIVKASIRPGR